MLPQPKSVCGSTGKTVLLFDLGNEQDSPKHVDTKLLAGIDRYLQGKSTHDVSKQKAQPEEKEADDDNESDYDLLSRGTMKVSSTALQEVLAAGRSQPAPGKSGK